jgi:hypothetical protein
MIASVRNAVLCRPPLNLPQPSGPGRTHLLQTTGGSVHTFVLGGLECFAEPVDSNYKLVKLEDSSIDSYMDIALPWILSQSPE